MVRVSSGVDHLYTPVLEMLHLSINYTALKSHGSVRIRKREVKIANVGPFSLRMQLVVRDLLLLVAATL